MQAELRDAESQLRKKEASLEELRRQLDEARRRASAAEGTAHDLQLQDEARDRELEVSLRPGIEN